MKRLVGLPVVVVLVACDPPQPTSLQLLEKKSNQDSPHA